MLLSFAGGLGVEARAQGGEVHLPGGYVTADASAAQGVGPEARASLGSEALLASQGLDGGARVALLIERAVLLQPLRDELYACLGSAPLHRRFSGFSAEVRPLVAGAPAGAPVWRVTIVEARAASRHEG